MSIFINNNGTAERKDNSGSGGATALTGLSDVAVSGVVDGQILVYDIATHKWKNANYSGGSGTGETMPEGSVTFTQQWGHADAKTDYPQNSTATIKAGAERFNDYRNRTGTSGTGNLAIGKYAHAEGNCTLAAGDSTHAEGENCVSKGAQAHSEGYNTYAQGPYSHSEGNGTAAKSTAAHSEGGSTSATGQYSHAEGQYATASGKCSHAGGENTIAAQEAQTAIGKYNENKSDTLFEVGKGTSTNDRSNAFEVTSDGYIRTKGRTDKIAFGVDSDGNYGYIMAGADTVIPFKYGSCARSLKSKRSSSWISEPIGDVDFVCNIGVPLANKINSNTYIEFALGGNHMAPSLFAIYCPSSSPNVVQYVLPNTPGSGDYTGTITYCAYSIPNSAPTSYGTLGYLKNVQVDKINGILTVTFYKASSSSYMAYGSAPEIFIYRPYDTSDFDVTVSS